MRLETDDGLCMGLKKPRRVFFSPLYPEIWREKKKPKKKKEKRGKQ
jgi:hypothetical protein